MLGVEAVIECIAPGTVREFYDTSFDEVVNVERDSSNRDCFVAALKLSCEVPTRRAIVLTCLRLA